MMDTGDFIRSLDYLATGESDPSQKLNSLKTKDSARAYMLESTSLSDWESRAQHILEVNGFSSPGWWMDLIIYDAQLKELKENLIIKNGVNKRRK